MMKRRSGPGAVSVIVLLAVALMALPWQVPSAAAEGNTIYLRLVSARSEPLALDGAGISKGDKVTVPYKWLISVDNTGNPAQPEFPDCYPYLDPPTNSIRNPEYPDKCDWPSIRTVPGWAPVYTQGDQEDLNETTGIDLPPGRYLISVLAEGFKLDGEHFSVPVTEPGLITVAVQPLPLPPATMVIKVFDDKSMTNGMFDAPVEQGLVGFRASVNDTVGEITQDLYGNPLCTIYEKNSDGSVKLDAEGAPIVETLGNGCYSDADGLITIPNLAPLRYDVLVIPPDDTDWVQTSTLEGSQGWDTWLMEGGTGLDNEFIVAAEPFPWTIFGFVKPTGPLPPSANAGSVKGVVMAAHVFVPFVGGLPYQGGVWGGLGGAKIAGPIERPWLSLNDLQNGDTAIWVGQGNQDGTFEIKNVPPGNYFLTYWDEKQHYILDFVQVTVQPNEVTDIGTIFLTGWFTEFYGTVFYDYNENGKQDPGEPGVPNYLVVLKDRDNTEIDRMSIASTTDANGRYRFEKAYPMGSWMVLEAYNDIYRTTGITFQASNQPEETTILGNGVDVHVLPVLGQAGRLDWGVKQYSPGTNGGIAGTVSYNTMRTELDPAYTAVDPYEPGIPGLQLRLYAAVKDEEGNFLLEADGSYKKGPLLATTITETYDRPTDCQARDVDGNPVDFPVLPPPGGSHACLEGPLIGLQFGTEFAPLDGNYAFTEIMTDLDGTPLEEPKPLPVGDYLVEVVIPPDSVFGRPLFQVTREEDVNIFSGDTYVPQVPPPPCAGPLHTVDVAGVPPDGPNAVVNPDFAAEGGSLYEGQQRHLCNIKLVTVNDQRSIAPTFNLFTEVPIPGKWKGYIIDDLNLGSDPFRLFFGEKAGVPNSPIGIYDFTNRLVETIQSDANGVFEVLLPSSATRNVPSPSGMAANVYYLVGNDPGQPGKPNALYNPQFRTIGASFEIYPGVIVPADLAPTQIAVSIIAPGSQFGQASQCRLESSKPQLFAVSRPYLRVGESFSIRGTAFGSIQGQGGVTLDGVPLSIISWSDHEILATITADVATGPHQLIITAANGESTVNGLTMHIIGPGYSPQIFEVGPGKTYSTIQRAVEAAAQVPQALVVVYPGEQVAFTNPLGIYYESVVMYSPIKLQGVGPGGIYDDGSSVPGSIMDGSGLVGDTVAITDWRRLIGDIWLNRGGWDGSPVDAQGNPLIFDGAVIYILANDGEFTDQYRASIDGLLIQGGTQQGFPNNLNPATGERIPGVQPIVVAQGGGIFVNGYARYLQISNNIIRSNGGAYAGAIRLGTPDAPEPLKDNQNDSVIIAYNRILANGGTNLAGAIGVFAGAENYEIAYNDICGNFSAEYGGGISHYGYSPNGKIHHNRIYFNRSFDEGGGIMIAGELPADFRQLSPGAGPVDIHDNLIQANLSNDDGGGLRFLMAGNFPYNVYNNLVVNNVSTHEGGGIAINDAPNVRVYNNTIVGNITTATAMTSNGQAAPAGLATARNSNLLQATLPPSAPVFSEPLLFNNLFWDNRAGTRSGDGISGIGLAGDPFPIFYWDQGVADNSGTLSPSNTIIQVPYGLPEASNIVGANPQLLEPFSLSVSLFPWRGNPSFVGADIVSVDLPPGQMGNWHLAPASPAVDAGTAEKEGILAPDKDIDGEARPLQGGYDIGADETYVYRQLVPHLASNYRIR